MNSYPYLDAKARPVFTNDLGDIIPRTLNHARQIDISTSPLVPATQLRKNLDYMHMAGELDGGIPVLRDGILVGLIPGPDLEFALDGLGDEAGALCLMSASARWQGLFAGVGDGTGAAGGGTCSPPGARDAEEDPAATRRVDPTDFTPYIDPAPVALDISSPMDLVFECFVKLGLRYVCVLREGKFAGLLHKKAFVRYVKELEEAEGKR